MSRKLILGKDRIGNRSGKLEIVDYFPAYNQVTGISDGYFNIKCDCGNIISRSISHISRFNKMKNCGCETIVNNPWERIFNRWKYTLLDDKKTIKQTTTLTLDQFIKLSSDNCFYCNSEKSNKTRITGIFITGIDRLDNNIGYDLYNCVSCCKKCNLAKHTNTKDEFIEMCIKVANHQSNK